METNKIKGTFMRHGESGYKTVKKDLTSENPQKAFDRENQLPEDLTEKGKLQAQEGAKEILKNLKPEQTMLHVWSSDEARAVNTSQIFIEEATKLSFKISPSNPKRKGAYWLTTEPISRTEVLSISTPNTLLATIFMPTSTFRCTQEMLQTEGESAEDAQILLNKISEIREIIDRENQEAIEQGEAINWGRNYAKFGDYVNTILPDVDGPEQIYRLKFIKGVRLLQKKSQDSNNTDHIVLFGHENILLHFLKSQFKREHYDNCEILNFSVDHANLYISLSDGTSKTIAINELGK
jgi:hypothetical protein